ncbi:MAG: BrnT family toxin [Candidatus Eisenbacteria bacterium]|uniref:BrnT family toxin n=1 Tax=Eiseniibacteriota bacterium TaxID=2212470 RepID=A0A538SAJ8_UNCEI|nr:MAG: BrnT family toxin [Candidatus Eisenbacteria bacterium]
MAELKFEWDHAKDIANQRKHGISFAEAASVFSDDHALLLNDPDHSAEEDRFVLLGLSFALRVIVVHHTFRAGGDVIRLISARKATRVERAHYVQRWRQ